MKKHLLIFLPVCLVLAACASQENGRSLVGPWRLAAYGPVDSPTPAVPDVDATLTLGEDGSLTGSTGCNELGGEYTVEGDQIAFRQVVSTLILCPDLQMAQEEAMLQVLSDTATFNIEGNTLTIINNGTVLVFAAETTGS